MEKSKNEIVIKNYDLGKPNEIVNMAKTLKNYIVKENLFVNIKGRNYAMVEGWQFAGFLTGLNVIADAPVNLSNENEIKWGCVAKIYSKDVLVGSGYAVCSNQESNKKSFEEYAIVSMAQTRAIGKAYRNKIGWVMKLANMEATPMEEMSQVQTEIREERNKNVKEFFENMKPTEDELIPYREKLESAKDLKELKSFWSKMPELVRESLEGFKEKLKDKLK